MPAALPPVTDCGCETTTSSDTPSDSTACCPLNGVNNPNFDGIVPPDPTVRAEYRQWSDLTSGTVQQLWYWNPYLQSWG